MAVQSQEWETHTQKKIKSSTSECIKEFCCIGLHSFPLYLTYLTVLFIIWHWHLEDLEGKSFLCAKPYDCNWLDEWMNEWIMKMCVKFSAMNDLRFK